MDFTAEILDANRAWMRRLAAALVRDPGLAEDLAQETWEAALRQPPGEAGALRPWLRRVLTNRLRNEARAQARRRTREQAASGAPDAVPTPEEVVARLELERRVCALVADLDEPHRQVVFLRFFEERDSPDIARLLGIAEGTVRWRLKAALDELRARLDRETEGGRRRWRLLLAPLAGGQATPAPGTVPASRSLFTLGPLVAIMVVLAAAGVWFLAGRSPRPVITADRPSADRAVTAGRPPALQRAVVAADGTPCPEAGPLRDELALRARELEGLEPLQELFARSTPNPVAQERFGALLAPLLGTPPRCPYTLECRGRVCRGQFLLEPESRGGYRTCLGGAGLEQPDRVFIDYLASRRSGTFGNDTPVWDPVAHKSWRRVDAYYHLLTATVDRMPLKQRPPVVALTPGRYRAWPPPAPGRSEGCRRQLADLQNELGTVLARGDVAFRPQEAFAVNDPSPATTAELLAVLPGMTGLSGDPFPLRVECRGPVCSLEPRDSADPTMEIKQICEGPAEERRCQFDREHDGWFARLWRGSQGHDLIGRVEQPGPGRPTYLRIRTPTERRRLGPMQAACAFADRVQQADLIDTCTRTSGGKGTLDLKLTVPGPEDADRHIIIDYAGDLAGTPLGRCLVEGLRAIAASEALPATRHSLVIHRQPTFPGAPNLWGGRSPCRGR